MSDEEVTKPHTLRYELVYRVWKEIEVNEENYGAEYDPEVNGTLEEFAFRQELSNDEEDLYTQIFEEEIAANGPDAAYVVIQLIDPDGNVVRQGTVDDLRHEASVRPQYLVDGMEIEQA
jgi:hypothetical protein